MRRLSKLGSVLASTAVAVTLMSGGAVSTAASVPHADASTITYPVNEVVREADDKCGRHALLRRGYFNGRQGFGFDKMFHKHNLKHTGVFVFVLGNPNCGHPQNDTTRVYDAYANRVQCSIGGCQVVDIRRIYMPVNYRIDPGIPGQKGVITAYCFEGGEARCPDWVDQSINLRAGTDNSERTVMSYSKLAPNHTYSHAEINQLESVA